MVQRPVLRLKEWYKQYKKRLELQRVRYKTKIWLWLLKLSEINIAPLFVFLILILFFPNRGAFILLLCAIGIYYTYRFILDDIYKPWLSAYERKR